MDLLRQILVRLSLERFIIFGDDLSLVKLRLRAVNRRSDEISDYRSYLRLCTLQGEICSLSHEFVNRTWLTSRAAFLNDSINYDPSCEFEPNIDLRSSDERIKLRVVKLFKPTQTISINDPASIGWTAEMKEITLKALWVPRTLNRENYFLLGYLAYPDSAVVDKDLCAENISTIFGGFVEAAMKEISDPFMPHPIIEGIISGAKYSHALRSVAFSHGYFAYHEKYRADEAAVRDIQPALLERCWALRAFTDPALLGDPFPSTAIPITEGLLMRARQMLALERNLTHHYMIFLRILLGLQVDISAVDQRYVNTLIIVMLRIAHPQLTKELIQPIMSFLHIVNHFRACNISYDLVNYFHIMPVTISEKVRLHQIFASGKALEIEVSETFTV